MADQLNDVGNVRLKRINSVVILILSRPKYHNSLNLRMYEQLEEQLDELKNNNSVKVLIIRGSGNKAFAAGTDITHFKNFTGDKGVEYERTIDRIVKKLEEFPKPTIAAINGYTIGGGLALATACDLRYATKKSKFGVPIAKTLGNCLSLDNYLRISKEFGVMSTKEMLFTGRLFNADEAEKKGFITDILEEDKFFEEILDVAKEIENNAPSTIEATKIAFNRIGSKTKNQSIIDFEDVIYKVYDSDVFNEGVNAYIEKRKPRWENES